jgi:signal recognition particle subunit SRP54
MGDIVSLVEKAQEVVDQEEVQKRAEALFTGTFTMEDFLGLFEQMKKLGPMKQVLEQAGPGFAQLTEGMSAEEMEDQMVHTKAMILSMTPDERFQPELIDHPRRRRIARGSGTSLDEVNQLLKEFKHTRKMFKQIGQQGGFGGFLVRRGFRKRKMRQLKDMKKQGGLPFNLPGLGGKPPEQRGKD